MRNPDMPTYLREPSGRFIGPPDKDHTGRPVVGQVYRSLAGQERKVMSIGGGTVRYWHYGLNTRRYSTPMARWMAWAKGAVLIGGGK